MVEKRLRRSIVCPASVAASSSSSRSTNDVMSKHAVLGLMRAANVQLAVHGIREDGVSPNGLDTPLICYALGMSVEKVPDFSSRLQGAVLTPKHVADAFVYCLR